MGHWVKCLVCETEVYTTGSRVPLHSDANGKPCTNSKTAREPVEYSTSGDSDPGVYQGGLPELGKGN